MELAEVCDALCEQVRMQPGASMVELAEVMGAGVQSLQRPMAKLKAAGRVRSVGQRHLTRYYPTVVGATGSGA
jgi:predicted transcriptional regulator